MSLNFNLGNIPDWKKVTQKPDGSMSAITETLIFRSMSVDLGEVSKENVAEWMFRLKCVTRVFGPPLRKLVVVCDYCHQEVGPDGCQKPNCSTSKEAVHDNVIDREFTLEEVRAHVGLTTNVSDKTRIGFLKHLGQRLERDIQCDVEAMLRKEKEAAV